MVVHDSVPSARYSSVCNVLQHLAHPYLYSMINHCEYVVFINFTTIIIYYSITCQYEIMRYTVLVLKIRWGNYNYLCLAEIIINKIEKLLPDIRSAE